VGEETGEAMLTCTLIIVLLTVLVIGGATPTLVRPAASIHHETPRRWGV
jgi:hypothetical protein